MSWNFAIGVKEIDGQKHFGIVEEYHIDGHVGWTDFVTPAEGSIDDLIEVLHRMIKDAEARKESEPHLIEINEE